MSIINQLNAMYGSFLSRKCIPVEYSGGHVQEFNPTELAVTLDEPTIIVTEIKRDDPAKYDNAITRVIVGYRAASEMSNDYLYGIETLSHLKNYLYTLVAKKYDLNECTATLLRPNGKYFDELDNYAGYELRLFIKRKTQGE